MSESKYQKRFEIAIDLKLLNQRQVEAIALEVKSSNSTPLDIAIQKGYLNRKHTELLDILADPTSVVPGYRIDGFLGQGGVGTVFKATQLRMDRAVAIKTIHRTATRNDLTPKRFEREAKIVGQLRHPNIVSAFDFGIHNEQLYLVMEFVDGIDAQKLLRDKHRVPEMQAWYIAQQVCHALENAHKHDVIHRDIKPGNLILTAAPVGTSMPPNVPFVKVGDFGLAKFNDKQLDATITLEHSVSGTPFYMSPEQIKAEEIDHRSDIYSMGATIWHLITGEPPVSGTGPLDVIATKMKIEDEWLAKSPIDMSQSSFNLLRKMCRHDREQRISDYPTIGLEIESVIKQLGQDALSKTQQIDQDSEPFSVPAKVTTVHEMAKTFIGDSDLVTDSETRFLNSNEVKPYQPEQYKQAESLINQMPSKGGWRFPPWLALTIGAIALPVVIYYSWPTSGQVSGTGNSSSGQSTTTERTFATLTEFSGPPLFLFDGRSLDATQRASGTWEPSKGSEGEAVLSGNGTRNFLCRDKERKPLENFRFNCGFRHNLANTIGFRLLNGSEKVLWEVNVEPEQAVLYFGVTESSCSVAQFDEDKTFGYHQFRLESQPDHWRIEVDNEVLSEFAKPPGEVGDNLTIQLFTVGPGPAHFEQIRFRQFKSN